MPSSRWVFSAMNRSIWASSSGLDQVALVQYHHDLLAPVANQLEEAALGLRKGAIRGGHE